MAGIPLPVPGAYRHCFGVPAGSSAMLSCDRVNSRRPGLILSMLAETYLHLWLLMETEQPPSSLLTQWLRVLRLLRRHSRAYPVLQARLHRFWSWEAWLYGRDAETREHAQQSLRAAWRGCMADDAEWAQRWLARLRIYELPPKALRERMTALRDFLAR